MLDLAQGAASLGEWDRAEQAAEQALAAARDQRQAKVMFSAETLLDSIRNGRKIESVQVQPSDDASHDADQFAATMVRTLEMASAR
ncbi:MAG TPA: hypothetical protein VF705_12275, partial [Longimicrobium sp.]